MRNCNVLTVGLLFVGSTAFAGFTRAATPAFTPTAGGHGVVAMADDNKEMHKDMNDVVSDDEHLQHLRDARKHLNEAKDAFDADKPERGNRASELEHIDKAINAIDDEIKTAEDKMKK